MDVVCSYATEDSRSDMDAVSPTEESRRDSRTDVAGGGDLPLKRDNIDYETIAKAARDRTDQNKNDPEKDSKKIKAMSS